MFRLTTLLAGSVLVLSWLVQLGAASDYSTTVLADNPIGYWRLGEATGSAVDASGHGLDGGYASGVTRDQPGALADDPDGAALFNGSSGYVNLGKHTSLYNLTNDFTIEAWVRNPSSSAWTGKILSTRNYDAGYAFGANSSLISFTTYTRKDYSWSFDFPADEWVYVAVVFDAENDANFYANGQLLGTQVGSQDAKTSAQTCMIGRNPIKFTSYEYYAGNLDEVAIYGRSLGPEEIREHYLAAIPEPSTIILLLTGALGLLGYRIRRK